MNRFNISYDVNKMLTVGIDNRRFRCVVVRSIDMDMIVSHYNNNYLIGWQLL